MLIKRMSDEELKTSYRQIKDLRDLINDTIKQFEEFTYINSIMTKEIEHAIEQEVGQRSLLPESLKSNIHEIITEDEWHDVVDNIIASNPHIILRLGDRAISSLMGIAMKELRGKVSGEAVNSYILEKLKC